MQKKDICRKELTPRLMFTTSPSVVLLTNMAQHVIRYAEKKKGAEKAKKD